MTRHHRDDKTKSSLVGMVLFAVMMSVVANAAEPEADKKELPRLTPTEPAQALATFKVAPGYRLELVAAEPLVADPIAMAFDARRRLYVVEMRGYSERREGKLGRVRRLTDEDGDGDFDRSTIFAEGLAWPTAVIAWDGGVFVAATPDIFYFKDEDGDGVAEVKKKVFSGFGAGVARLNVQALVNNLKWGPDGRIHGATAGNGGKVYRVGDGKKATTALRGLDFSFDPKTLDFRAENGGGQYGLCFDREGRKFVCSNSNHIQQVLYPRRYAGAPLRPARVGIAADGPAAEVFRISPDEPWRVVRTRWRVSGKVKGIVEGGGRVSGYFTAATGIEIHHGEAFICDAGSNLVHRKQLVKTTGHTQLHAQRIESESAAEFLASSDNWFRPVQCLSGPDGALYIADMYREVIEHPWSLPQSIKKHLDLNSGNDRGRIYRVVPEDFVQPGAVDLESLNNAELVERLSASKQRSGESLIQKELRRRPDDPAAIAKLLRPAITKSAAALGLFRQLGGLDEPALLRSLGSDRIEILRQAVALSESLDPLPARTITRLGELPALGDRELDFQIALTLGRRDGDWRLPILAEILAGPSNPWVEAAVLKALGSSAVDLFDQLKDAPPARLIALARIIGKTGTARDIERGRALASGDATDIEMQLLAAFAGQDTGKPWMSELAPDAKRIASDPDADIAERLAAIRLHRAFGDRKIEPAGLVELLATTKNDQIREAVIEQLAHWDGTTSSAEAIVAQWEKEQLSPRGKVLAKLALLRPARAATFLNAIRDKKIPSHHLDGATVDRLKKHPDQATRELAAKILGKREGIAARLERYKKSPTLKGDPKSGRIIFLSRCSICHRQGKDQGFAYGPDVASFSSAGKESILLNLIDPNREVPPQFRAHQLTLDDGSQLAGMIIDQNREQVQLALPAGIEKTMPRKQIKRIDALPGSPMPENLDAGLTPKQMADLLEFLAGKQPKQN